MTNIDDPFNDTRTVRQAPATRDEILDHIRWSKQREVATKRGPRLVKSAAATTEILAAYNQDRNWFFQAGYSFGEFNGRMNITRWEEVPKALVLARVESLEASRATDADVQIPAPDGCDYLPFQKAGIAYGHARTAVLFGDEMGLGKTVEAIGLLNADPTLKRILVVCPASLKLNWRHELEKWLCRKRVIFIADSKLFPDLEDGIVIINYDILSRHTKQIKSVEWDAVIIDEAHFLKNKDALRTRQVFGREPKRSQKAAGDQGEPAIRARKKILLTGTPIANRPNEIFPLIHFLDPENWPSFWSFARRYCGAHNNGFGWDVSGATNLDELQRKLRETILIRRLKKDVLTELPPKRRQIIELPATGAAVAVVKAERAAYAAREDTILAEQARVELAKASEDPAVYAEAVKRLRKCMMVAFDEISALRHETAVAKIPQLIEFTRDAIEESGKVVLFLHHKDCVAAVAREFGNAAVMLVGDTEMADRQAAVDRFQNDPTCTLFIGSTMAAGVGITLTASAHVIIGELDWVPGNVTQAEDRTHRIGQRESVLVQHLVLENSLDAHIAKTIVRKQEIIERALDVRAEDDGGPVAEAGHATHETSRKAVQEEAQTLTPTQIESTTRAIRLLAAMCDGARLIDGAGFNKLDAQIGKSLAGWSSLTPRQAVLARKICLKYRRQLPEELYETMKGTV